MDARDAGNPSVGLRALDLFVEEIPVGFPVLDRVDPFPIIERLHPDVDFQACRIRLRDP